VRQPIFTPERGPNAGEPKNMFAKICEIIGRPSKLSWPAFFESPLAKEGGQTFQATLKQVAPTTEHLRTKEEDYTMNRKNLSIKELKENVGLDEKDSLWRYFEKNKDQPKMTLGLNGFDLMGKLLCMNPKLRWTCRDALTHHFLTVASPKPEWHGERWGSNFLKDISKSAAETKKKDRERKREYARLHDELDKHEHHLKGVSLKESLKQDQQRLLQQRGRDRAGRDNAMRGISGGGGVRPSSSKPSGGSHPGRSSRDGGGAGGSRGGDAGKSALPAFDRNVSASGKKLPEFWRRVQSSTGKFYYAKVKDGKVLANVWKTP
jgi:hypothetical protein